MKIIMNNIINYATILFKKRPIVNNVIDISMIERAAEYRRKDTFTLLTLNKQLSVMIDRRVSLIK